MLDDYHDNVQEAISYPGPSHRGCYKEYIINPAKPVPRQTFYNQRKRKRSSENKVSCPGPNHRRCYKKYITNPAKPVPKQTFSNQQKRIKASENKVQVVISYPDPSQGRPRHTHEAGDMLDDYQDNASSDESDLDVQVKASHVSDEDDGNAREFNQTVEGVSESNVNDDSNQSHDEPDPNDNGDFHIERGNEPIYPGALITKSQSLLLIFSLALRHGLSDEALNDLLGLMNLHCPDSVPRSKYLLYKNFQDSQCEIHFYCENCTSYLGPDRTNRNCSSCGTRFYSDVSAKDGKYFIRIPIKDQLKSILCSEEVSGYMENRNTEDILNEPNLKDIVYGQHYKHLLTQGAIGQSDVTLLLNTDGVSVFKSSNYSVWPILATINELPPHLRRQHIIMGGLWFGSSKPRMNTFFKPFTDELFKLGTMGFQTRHVNRKAFVLALSADAPARAIIRNCKQFNGAYGCDWCVQEGTAVPNANGPPIRTYPYMPNIPLRTNDGQRRLAVQSQNTEVPQQGVKGPSVVMLLPRYDCAKGVCSELQHTACLGVTRQFFNTWLKSSNHGQDFYIGNRIKQLDTRLRSICPPSEISRCPRSISSRKYWKASEYRALIFYSIPILNGILPKVYLRHWFLFVYALHRLMGDNILTTSVHKAEACLKKFVLLNSELYGARHCTFNVHSLIHFAQNVFNFGPLWATSTFLFEGYNGTIKNLFKGTQQVPSQITEMFMMVKSLSVLAGNCIDINDNPTILDLYKTLAHGYVKPKHVLLGENLLGLGRGNKTILLPSRLVAIQALVGAGVNRSAMSYKRFLYRHQLFAGLNYVRSIRHCNSYITFSHDLYKCGQIESLVSVRLGCECLLDDICHCEEAVVLLVKPLVINQQHLYSDVKLQCSSDFILQVKPLNKYVCIYPKHILQKCINMNFDGANYICPLPGRFYWD